MTIEATDAMKRRTAAPVRVGSVNEVAKGRWSYAP